MISITNFLFLGKGIAALTLDEDYQKKRRQRLAQQQSSIAEGSRGLVMVSTKLIKRKKKTIL